MYKRRCGKKLLDYVNSQDEVHKNAEEMRRIIEEGENFEIDKALLEEIMQEIDDSDFSFQEKKMRLNNLKEAVIKLQKEYEEKVTDPMEKLEKEAREEIERMKEAEEELREQENSLRNVKLKSGAVDISDVIEETAAKKTAFEKMRDEYVQELDIRMEQAKMQQRNMMLERIQRGY